LPRWVLFQRPSSERLVSLSISSCSPVAASKPRLDDHQVGCGLCASRAPPRSWSSGHLFSFPCSPTYWVTRSVVSEPTAHIPVRLCHAITALRLGYYENSGTIRLASCRPSHVPHQRNVLARRRCPIHALECVRYASSIGQGVAWKKADSIPTDGVGYTDVLPTSVRFHHWTLGFGQCSSHRIMQALQDHAIHVF
jgi:hypothetical protein